MEWNLDQLKLGRGKDAWDEARLVLWTCGFRFVHSLLHLLLSVRRRQAGRELTFALRGAGKWSNSARAHTSCAAPANRPSLEISRFSGRPDYRKLVRNRLVDILAAVPAGGAAEGLPTRWPDTAAARCCANLIWCQCFLSSICRFERYMARVLSRKKARRADPQDIADLLPLRWAAFGNLLPSPGRPVRTCLYIGLPFSDLESCSSASSSAQ